MPKSIATNNLFHYRVEIYAYATRWDQDGYPIAWAYFRPRSKINLFWDSKKELNKDNIYIIKNAISLGKDSITGKDCYQTQGTSIKLFEEIINEFIAYINKVVPYRVDHNQHYAKDFIMFLPIKERLRRTKFNIKNKTESE